MHLGHIHVQEFAIGIVVRLIRYRRRNLVILFVYKIHLIPDRTPRAYACRIIVENDLSARDRRDLDGGGRARKVLVTAVVRILYVKLGIARAYARNYAGRSADLSDTPIVDGVFER